MPEQRELPYICHIFVCTNDRQGARKSCAGGGGAMIRTALKEGVAARGWKGRVRVSQAGCLGLCEEGPNVILYPHKIWFSSIELGDVDGILSVVERILSRPEQH